MTAIWYLTALLGIYLTGVYSMYSYDDIPVKAERDNAYDEHEVVLPDPDWYKPEEKSDESLELRVWPPPGFLLPSNDTYPMTIDQKQKRIINILSHQLRLTQLAMEEKVRSDGDSGIKQIRVLYTGTRPYHTGHHSGYALAAIHEHVDNRLTLGSGEFVVVLNGVEFRTRHNDFQLRQPHSTSKKYHDTEEIAFPPVPDAVLNQPTVQGQVNEMREWFKAFAKQDYSVRDYRPYFKPVMCYLEGAWTKVKGKLEEPFYSDRHSVDASTWLDLEQKIRFTSHTGRKDLFENYPHLPIKIIDIKNGIPVTAQWNYRIMCHPLKGDLPTYKLRPVDDLAPRFAEDRNFQEHVNSRAARFELHNDAFSYDVGLLDKIMSEIPGKDNYQGYIEDNAFNLTAYSKLTDTKTPINAAFYHRYFSNDKKGAMGSVDQSRGFSDRNVFVAMTSQDKVFGSKVVDCKFDEQTKKDQCSTYHQKMSYAIPFELVYITPLTRWNPRNIQYKGEYNSKWGKTIMDGPNGKRDGGFTKDRAFNGTNSWYYYMTPAEFFASDAILEGEPADTAKDSYGILDKDGNVQLMRPAGHHIFLSKIPDVGKIRLRYPVVPVHGEGSGVWKELEALKDAVMDMNKYMHLYRNPCNITQQCQKEPHVKERVNLRTSLSHGGGVAAHSHTVILSREDYLRLQNNPTARQTITTTLNNSHNHELMIKYDPKEMKIVIVKCGGQSTCWDGHQLELFLV